MGQIYGLHSGDEVIRYIGQTRVNARTRFWKHRSEAKTSKRYNHELHDWIMDNWDTFSYVILEDVPDESLDERESYWCSQFSDLLNKTTGGTVGHSFAPESVALRSGESAGMFGVRLLGEANPFFGKTHSPEFIARKRGEGSGTAKLTSSDVVEIRTRVAAGEKQIALSREYDVGPMEISRIVRKLRWAHID